MSLKRLWGILLGIVVGIIPLVNTFGATIFSYKLKKKQWTTIYGVIAGITLVLAVVINIYGRKEKPIKAAFPEAFRKNLQMVSVKRDMLIDSVGMETALQQVLRNTAHQLVQEDEKNKPLLENAQQGKLSAKPQAAFHQLSQYLYRDYLDKVKAGTENDKYDLTFDTEKLAADQQATRHINNFTEEYLTAEHGAMYAAMSGLVLIGYVIACVGCISSGANLFLTPGEEATNVRRAGVDDETVSRSFNRQPAPEPEPEREEPIVSPPAFQPPPLPPRTPPRTPPPLPQQEPISSVVVKVNTAEEEELMQLRGINRILAKTIISERNTNGNFTDINDLKRRMELSSEQVDRIRGNVDFDAPKRGGGRVIEY
ncbi:ComEA family DNA-binding protein [Chitinophaga varians]|uniref:ComEA family DNA-binding protein n=1 Tax=Chitinophaga varians TaxID=2202339 RepID=UPI00165F6E37|nr:helix-hairpin-helix domain-containing protein [Chitinophaga varians]MBC9911689.1 helix-hairpin-helix domain-containing protein [Chitinophaga varians]